jgi:hypothetical protein
MFRSSDDRRLQPLNLVGDADSEDDSWGNSDMSIAELPDPTEPVMEESVGLNRCWPWPELLARASAGLSGWWPGLVSLDSFAGSNAHASPLNLVGDADSEDDSWGNSDMSIAESIRGAEWLVAGTSLTRHSIHGTVFTLA